MTRSASSKPAAAGRASPPPQAAAPNNVAQKKSQSTSKKKPKDYTSEGVEDNDIFLLSGSDFQLVLAVTLVSAAVRLFRIYQPSSVVFDEVHFGGFASKYIKGRFFMDVHPPLAKLMITLFGWLAGFDGSFDFKEIGKDYVEPGVPYVAMRLFPALCGIFLAPTMFLTLKAAGCRSFSALMGAGFIIFENGLLTQARLILLDSPLMIGTAFTALAFTSFNNQQELGPSRAFGLSWWFWLAMTGLGLGITFSIKWVGLFTIAWVGFITLVHLWVLWGDYNNVTIRTFAKHFLARAFFLIIVPLGFYMAMFAIHFTCLRNPGEGDGFMSSEFQSTLNSKGMKNVPADVLMGSRVSIRHVNTQGGYLHSHPLMYPTGSKQQQVTLYPHKDDNNLWLLENQTQPLDMHGQPINGTSAWYHLPEPHYIQDGTIVRLYHLATHRRLHSHDVRPPITEADWQNEVSAYGYEGFDGDANDFFRVEIVKKKSKPGVAQQRLRTIDTKFRLVHIMTGCVLFSHKVKLPEWASEQQEVTCARGGTLPNSLWYVEYNEHPKLGPDAETVNYRNPGFFGKFWELQKVMWKTNAGLTDSHAWDSRPQSWPILRRGINFWGKEHRQIYLIGNPLIWWSATAAVVLYAVFKGIAVLRWQRSCNDYAITTFKRFDYEIGASVLGWALHYFPFYLMQRQLFLHHYFPALYFGIMAFCQIYDFVTARISLFGLRDKPIIGKAGAVGLLVLSIVVFTLFSPLAYGNTWTKAECKRVKLFKTWDWDCNTFLDSYDAYKSLPTSQPAAVPTQAANRKPNAGAPPAANKQAQQGGEKPAAGVSAGAPVPANHQLLRKEEHVEYRDQDGNLLNEEQVKALEGKVEFKTRYETRTRIIDPNGNEVVLPPGEPLPEGVVPMEKAENKAGVAPPHPDAEGINSETKRRVPDEPLPVPEAKKSVEGLKERGEKVAKPASEKKEASAELKDEL
ncbi:hypothetical protein VTJ83DRAFT_1563 [Remersonia thermophila]|uniref:Dolichyl-phosphate-mannose--protein mannosyltransferase n=1 Tax=Remersonia thermophila TaxID=72144 RepID=A0ABR4DGG0_9PEZI